MTLIEGIRTIDTPLNAKIKTAYKIGQNNVAEMEIQAKRKIYLYIDPEVISEERSIQKKNQKRQGRKEH